jgi:hypothetical protein
MAQPSDSFKRNRAFFHALSKTNTESTQYVFESQYKSAHSVRGNEVWADVVGYALNSAAADNFVTANPTVLVKYVQVSLTEIPGSNGQAWYINDTGEFVKPFVSPVDVPHPTSGLPSFGYEAKLYKQDDTLISPTNGVFIIDYYAGIVAMQEGYTPANLGWGIPKLTCYAYVGTTLGSIASLNLIANEVQIISSATNSVTLQNIPSANSLKTFLNGMKLTPSLDFTISPGTDIVNFSFTIPIGTTLNFEYRI